MATRPPVFRRTRIVDNWRWFRRDLLGLLRTAMDTSGEVVQIPLLYESLYLINDPEILREVLVTDYQAFGRGKSHAGLRRIIGDGMLTVENPAWVAQRRAAAPAFAAPRLRTLEDVIDARLSTWIARWDAAAERGDRLALANDFMALSAQVALDHFFEHALSDDEAFTFVDDFVRVQAQAFSAIAAPWKLLDRSAKDGLARIRAIAARLTPAPDRAALMPQAMTILATAPENPSNTLAWTLFLLARHPEAAQRVAAGDDGYLRAVVHEAIRLYPGAWGFERRTLGERTLGGYRIPPGAILMLSPYTLHRNPRLWSDPDAFVPDRFLGDPRALLTSGAYMPFSAGPRKCVGDRFTMVVVMRVLEAFTRRYRVVLDPAERGDMWPLFTLRPKTNLLARLERLEHGSVARTRPPPASTRSADAA